MTLLEWDDNIPQPNEYAEFYNNYIQLVGSSNVIQKLIRQGQQTYTIMQRLSRNEALHRYAEGKWSVQEIMGHLADTDRIMGYRALSISRGETKSLPGYDHDEYVRQGNFDNRSLQNIATEYDALRNANISMFNSLTKEQTLQKGTANKATVSVRALAYIIAGHERHHLNILEEKYGINISADKSN
jgi:uncharacterized damage-inducible protein DinB